MQTETGACFCRPAVVMLLELLQSLSPHVCPCRAVGLYDIGFEPEASFPGGPSQMLLMRILNAWLGQSESI